MTVQAILKVLWPIVLLLFLGFSVSVLAERLRAKTSQMEILRPNAASLARSTVLPPPTRLHAMLGGACILTAAFWGFDVMLAYWLDCMS